MFFKKKFTSLEECIFSSKKCMKKEGYNPLHLCILFDEPSWIGGVKENEHFITQKNAWGFTPPHLAMYLNRKKCLDKLGFVIKKTIKVEKNGIVEGLPPHQFEQKMGVEYLSHPEISSIRGLKALLAFSKKAKQKGLITHEEKWLGAYYQAELQYDVSPDIMIKWIDPIKGYGVFSNQSLKKKQWIGQYTGVLRKASLKKDRKNSYCFEYCTRSNFTIDAKEKGNITRFINHSYEPNLTPILAFSNSLFHIAFVTNRAVEKGEELTYDYGPDYWKKRESPLS